VTTHETDGERLVNLRAFLVEWRSRLRPADVGLPATERRRVVGLRREEVAELAGVSSDWYRWFESGRPIRVSTPFLAKLSQALRLNAREQRTLYHLALPELYEVDIAQRISWPPLSLLSPVQSLDEAESVVRRLATARDKFLSGGTIAHSDVRPRIVNSWKRSLMLGASPSMDVIRPCATGQELSARRQASAVLLDAAAPTFSFLKGLLADLGYAVVITDGSGCILEIAGERETLRVLSLIDFEPGADLSEYACGTNAIGTAVADERPLQVIGAENFAEGGGDLTCTAAPIRDPTSHAIVGVLDVTANYRRIHPEILSVVAQAAFEIEERIVATV
jgi:transcriptional regulator with XRE-family HTH domain